jgi:methyl-accepting chemotaxis protein
MTPATRSSTTHVTLLQSINHLMELLKNINNELEHIKESIQDVKENTNSLTEKTNHLDHKLETMDTATNDRIDKLCLQAGDIAVELDQLQLKTNDIVINLDQTQLTSEPSQALLNAINRNIDGKFRNIPSLIKHEIENNMNHQTE